MKTLRMSLTPIEISEAKMICNLKEPTDYQKKRLIKLRIEFEGSGRRKVYTDAIGPAIEEFNTSLDDVFEKAKKDFGYETKPSRGSNSGR